MVIILKQPIMISIHYILEFQIYKNSNCNTLQFKSKKNNHKNRQILLF